MRDGEGVGKLDESGVTGCVSGRESAVSAPAEGVSLSAIGRGRMRGGRKEGR